MKKLHWVLLLFLAAACNNNNTTEEDSANTNRLPEPATLPYSVLNVYPHDTSSFTEGLLFHDGKMYESTGSGDDNRYVSWMGPVDLKTGKGERKIILDKQYFGEGFSIFNGKIYQLTYQNHKGFVYDAKTYKKISEFTYPGEGWSLTHDSANLIMSDGTSKLQYLDPISLRVMKIVGVEDNNGPVGNINELEFINGYIYANQWLTNYILKINPASGKVEGKIDISNLDTEVKRIYKGAETANGIAYDVANGKMYITGKCWPNLYEIKIN